MKLQILFELNEDILEKGQFIIYGWVNQYRCQSDIIFFNILDGSTPTGIQVVLSQENNEELFEELKKLNVGCYVKLQGKIVKSPAKGQKYEFIPSQILEYSACDSSTYPLRKNTKLVNLRQIAHYRAKTKIFGCIYRIRNTLSFDTHNFFQNQRFLHLDPNVITTNECEGGAGVFTVTELMSNIPNDLKKLTQFENDHFKKQTFLTVSSQLQLEAIACGMGNCYTTNKSFRSEHSLTNKHVSEFTHLEIEMIDCKNEELMDMGEHYINYIIRSVYNKNMGDIIELDKFAAKGILQRFEELKYLKFYRKSYDDCIQLIKTNSDIHCEYGEDLSSEMEEFLTSHFGGAVFVYNWPATIKSFYMKLKTDNNDNDQVPLCENFDLLLPYGIGELIGGSMREHREDILLNMMDKKGVPREGLEWYIDLRKYGSIPHGGFGLGMDRLLMLVTGMTNIKDVIPFPVYYQNCNY